MRLNVAFPWPDLCMLQNQMKLHFAALNILSERNCPPVLRSINDDISPRTTSRTEQALPLLERL